MILIGLLLDRRRWGTSELWDTGRGDDSGGCLSPDEGGFFANRFGLRVSCDGMRYKDTKLQGEMHSRRALISVHFQLNVPLIPLPYSRRDRERASDQKT